MNNTRVRLLPGCCLLLVFLFLTPLADAACEGPEYRAFDFWLGEWKVSTAEGKFAGFNRITLEYGACVLHERYLTAGGYIGESLNTYDAGRKVWHQTWVDNTGTLLLLDGGIRDGKMVLEGETTDEKGQVSQQRITWTPNPDGSVSQLWQSRIAESKWETVFDGLYRKK